MKNDYIFDIETYPNVFTLAVEHSEAAFTWLFEISDWVDHSSDIVHFLHYLKKSNARMVGFNNIGFDYPVLHTLIRMGEADANTLYQKAQAIINSQDNQDRWTHFVKPSDYFVRQLDLYKIHHFDNKARATGLKALQFNMRSDSVEDLPFSPGTTLTQEQARVLKLYNLHDVRETKKFYHHTLPMIEFREALTRKYSRDFMNHNDTKIGKDYFIMELEKSGVNCYDYSQSGRTPCQTKRAFIDLKDAVLPWITFSSPEFNKINDWLKQQRITETKGVFKDLVATVKGFDFVFGLGGIHGSIEYKIIQSDQENMIIDFDVTSYYPNLAIINKFYPEHLGEKFVDIYKYLFEQRKQYSKKSAESAMLKLALNGVYGDSNNPFSVFYDPLFTMKITLNGQLLLCLLAEKLMAIENTKIIQVNTDGVTIFTNRDNKQKIDDVVNEWQSLTKLNLEQSLYKEMFVRDVNNYIAVFEDGKVKRKGAYEWDIEWHQNGSGLVIPKVAEKVLLENAPIAKTVREWPDIMDFMLRVKVPKGSHLSIKYLDQQPIQLQNTTRYYVAEGGGIMTKWMPPLKNKTEWREISVESGRTIHPCNNIEEAGKLPIDYDYYIKEVEKLCLSLA